MSIRRERAIAKHDKAMNIIASSFAVGEFVLFRRATDRGHKLRFSLFGTCRITSVHGQLVYGIAPLRESKTERVSVLKYRDSLLVKQISQDMLALAERTESHYEVIEKIFDLDQDQNGLFFQVQWDGPHDNHGYTWQHAKELYIDVPDLFTAFLALFNKKNKLVATVKRHIGISS